MISEAIKSIVEGYINNKSLSDVEIGEVVTINPLSIKVADFPEPISQEFLVVPERLVRDTYNIQMLNFEISFSHTCNNCNAQVHTVAGNGTATIKIDDITLVQGDKVILSKAQGGQLYVIMDRRI